MSATNQSVLFSAVSNGSFTERSTKNTKLSSWQRIQTGCVRYLFVLILALSATESRAVPVLWTLVDATFDDGGRAFGSFVFDADTNTYSDIAITTTPGTSHTGDSYQVERGLGASNQSRLILLDKPVCDLQDQHSLSLIFAVPQLTNAGGMVDLLILPGPTAGSRENLVQTCDGSSTGVRGFTGGYVTSQLQVKIDIKPGNKRNRINPRKRGQVWVAILSDTSASAFDPPAQVDIPTVEFGPDGAKANRYKVKDVNKDRVGDLLLRFKVHKTGISCEDSDATLTGETFDGQMFIGTDSIKTSGCNHKARPNRHRR